VLLASHAITLFRVDMQWTQTYILPLFDWQRSQEEARAAWQGFLWSPRLYRPLLAAFKESMLETARYYNQLGDHAEQYASFLTFVALDPGDTFTIKEMAETTRQLPAEGLQMTAQALTRALQGAGEQRGEYWRNRIVPYLKSVWPKSREVMTPSISENFGRLCVAAQESFPEAVKVLQHWLQQVEYPHYLVHLLKQANLCEQFPMETLTFLDVVIGENTERQPRELDECLDDIEASEPALRNDPRFIRLTELCERRGID
jgi:hypothetical protein